MTLSPTLPSPVLERRPRRNARLDELVADVRGFLADEPSLRGAAREAAILEAIDLDLRLERLGLRARLGPLVAEDLTVLDECAARLERLRVFWSADVERHRSRERSAGDRIAA